MKDQFASWLAELRNDGVSLPEDQLGGANLNLWCLSLPSDNGVSAEDLVGFLVDAAAVRRKLAAEHGGIPVTFYSWHDELAGQIRFSTARCTQESLPFSSPVLLVDHPAEIVEQFLRSQYRDGIPWSALNEVSDREQLARDEPAMDVELLRVWAERLA